MIKKKHLLLFILVFTVLKVSASPHPTISTSSSLNQYIGKQTEILIDEADTLTYWGARNATQFKPSNELVPNLGTQQGAIWFRFTIANDQPKDRFVLNIENAFLENVVLFQETQDGNYQIDSVSKTQPFWSRQLAISNPAFFINIPNGSVSHFYLKATTPTQFIVPIKLDSDESTMVYELRKNTLRGVYYGILLGILFYNLFIFYSTKDKSYLYFIFYIISVGLVQLNITGLGFKYLWFNSPFFESISLYIFPTLTAISSIGFTRYFLFIKDYVPRLNKLLSVVNLLYIILTLNAFFGNKTISYNFLNILGLPLSIMLIWAGIYIWVKHKYRPAFVFLIAWVLFLLSVIIFVLKDVGILPYNLLTISILQLGSASTIILLSIAVADKINLYKMQKESFQQQSIAAAEEKERLVREQNVILESNVLARTKELQESNTALEKTLKDLREAETHLVESEKMASLGQLTAGIAHEINNPINFVTSNVNPLKRDINTIKDILAKVEAIGLQEGSSEEKLTKIKQLKEEEDYDYILSEIDFLIKGINEGAMRTSEIVKGLRLFSRLDEEGVKPANINEGIDATLTLVNNQLNGTIVVEKNYTSDAVIECYPGKLNQVFLNTITNAIHAIHERWKETPDGVITITTQKVNDHLIVSIKDNGIGMTDEVQKRLFEPFFTTKQVGLGTGLGLSISWKTIMKHQGKIDINSTFGVGTEFIFTLPVKAPPPETNI